MSAVVTSFLSFCTAGVYQFGCRKNWTIVWKQCSKPLLVVDFFVVVVCVMLYYPIHWGFLMDYHNPLWEPCAELETLQGFGFTSKTKASAQ